MRFAWAETVVNMSPALDVAIRITVLLALGWVVHFAIRRGNPRWRVLLWRGVVVCLVLMPVLGILLPKFGLPVRVAKKTGTMPAPLERPVTYFVTSLAEPGAAPDFSTDAGWGNPGANEASYSSPPVLNAMRWLRGHLLLAITGLWGVMAIALVVCSLRRHLRLGRILKNSQPAPEFARRVLRHIATNLKCRHSVDLRTSGEVASPLVAGVFKPVILLPDQMVASSDDEDLHGVLAHELAHVKSGDLVWTCVLQALSILLWFHPLLWRVRGVHATACEEVCDAVAADYMGNASAYSGTLARVALALLRRRHLLGGIPMARRPQIRIRLEMLRQRIWASRLQRRWVVLSVLCGVAVLAALGEVKLTRAAGFALEETSVVPQTQPTGPNQAGSRLLGFPQDRSLGRLMVQDEGTGGGTEYGVWEYLTGAIGDVTVPGGKRVWLIIHNPDALKDLSPLWRLGPNDLYGLTIGCRGAPGLNADEAIMPYLSRLTGLEMLALSHINITHNGLRLIGKLKSLRHLIVQSEAALSGTKPVSRQLGDACLAHLAALRSLEKLVLASHEITDAGLSHLATLTSLKEIELWSSKVQGAGLVHLARLPSLRSLTIGGFKIKDASLKYLQNSTSLRELGLGDVPITDKGLAHLRNLTQLEALNLFNTQVSDQGLIHLKALGSLKRLDLGKRGDNKSRIGDAGVAYLKDIRSLESLKLPAGITDKGLADVGELAKLKCLHVSGAVTDEGVKHLAKLHLLEELSISGAGLTDAGMVAIAKLTNLRDLTLYGCAITDQGLAELRTLTSMRKLSLHGKNITPSGLNHLNAMRDLTELTVYRLSEGGPALNIGGLSQLKSLRLQGRGASVFRDSDLACLGKLTRLKSLYISPPGRVSDVGIAHLAGLTALERLAIGGPHVTNDGLKYLADMKKLYHLMVSGDITDPGLRHVERLNSLWFLRIASESAFGSAALERLRKKLPNLEYLTVTP